MNRFVKYLQFVKEAVGNIKSYQDIHIVIGNESCDLDSTISCLALGYLIHEHKCVLQLTDSTLVIPVINVSYQDFLLRSENCFVLQARGVSLDYLICRDHLNIAKLLETSKVTTSLVDHHVLARHDQVLEPTVTQIFDHRPLDSLSNWNDKNMRINIQQVGSCCTLIAEAFFEVDESLLNLNLAFLLYQTIIYDTVALLPENGRAKELDHVIVKKLENKFSFKEDRKIVYDKLWAAHNDISHLTLKQVLAKDLKFVENIPVPGLPMLVENFLKLDDAHESINQFANDCNASLLVLVGLDSTEFNKVKRDVGIFWRNEGKNLKDLILSKLYNSEALKGYNFCFTEICSGYKDVLCLRQNNIKLSRKQIVPIIKDAVMENINI